VGAHSGAVFVGLGDVVGTDRDQSAVADFEFAMELHESFRLPAVLRLEPSATQHEDHRMLPLQIGQLPPFRGVVESSWSGKTAPGTMSNRMRISLVGCSVCSQVSMAGRRPSANQNRRSVEMSPARCQSRFRGG
jgi:hypothetical protein